MDAALERLLETQQAIAARNELGWAPELCEKLLFCPIGDWLHVEFYGLASEESFKDFVRVLRLAEVAERITSLVFRGPDEGANGTRNWDFTPLLESGVMFPHLRSFYVEPTLPEHHNQTIIASFY